MGQYPPGPEGMLLHLSFASETGFLESVVCYTGASLPKQGSARHSPVPLSRRGARVSAHRNAYRFSLSLGMSEEDLIPGLYEVIQYTLSLSVLVPY